MSTSMITGVPHLTTASSAPLEHLEKHFLIHQTSIETWLREQWQHTPAPLTCSVDLRNAGFKLAPVDTNLFPAGFNNLNPDFMPLCVQAVRATLEAAYPQATRVMIIPESHTRNLAYLENVAILQQIFIHAGYQVRLGSLLNDLPSPAHIITLPSGETITLHTIERRGDQLVVAEFVPDIIVSNNDLSAGTPEILQHLTQPVTPSLCLGWSHRLKSQHFAIYQTMCEQFAEIAQIDPWLINPLFTVCDDINFVERTGSDALEQHVDELLTAIQAKYREHDIDHQPFVFVKADAGTYGMGVMMVNSAQQVRELNRKQRTKMAASKGKQQVSRVIIQEGVPSNETWGETGATAEPVIYMLGHHVVGGFYRVNQQRSSQDNLNSPGMTFEHLAFAESCLCPQVTCKPDDCRNRFYAYGVVARLALVAAAREAYQVKHSGDGDC